MSWLLSIGIVILVIAVLVGIAILISYFELELIWCYVMLFILVLGLIFSCTMLVHKLLF